MHRIRWISLIAIFVAMPVAALDNCVYFDGFSGESSSAPTAVWKSSLDVHNCARRTVMPDASPRLPLLRWSASLAATAQNHANQCAYAHSGAPGLGENIYAAAPWASSEKAAVLAWISEAARYNYAANSCAGICGHYTQVVWRGSTSVGCGSKNCSSNTPLGAQFPNWTFVVCNYSPGGNIIGQRPY